VVDPPPGHPGAVRARFAFVADGGFSTARGELLQDGIATGVAAYPDTAGATAIVPRP
jgi:hypothetical protein